MANDYYNASFIAQPQTVIRSDDFNSNNQEVVAGFERLPTETDIKRSQAGEDVSLGAALYEVTVPYLTTGYQDLFTVTFQATFTNTGAANISVNGQSVVALQDAFGNAIAAGSIIATQVVTVVYVQDKNIFQIVSTSSLAADVSAAEQAKIEAEAARDAAQLSEANAASSEASAATSEANAATSEANAALSETNAAVSEANAAASALLARPPLRTFNTTGNVTINDADFVENIITRVGAGDGTVDVNVSVLADGDRVTIVNTSDTAGIATITNNDGVILLPDGSSAASHTLTGRGIAYLQQVPATNDLTLLSVVA